MTKHNNDLFKEMTYKIDYKFNRKKHCRNVILFADIISISLVTSNHLLFIEVKFRIFSG